MQYLLSLLLLLTVSSQLTASSLTATERDILTISNINKSASFGYSIALENDIAVVGAYKEYDDTIQEPIYSSGAAFVYKRNENSNFVLIAKLTASDAQASDNLGASVLIEGNTIVVGTYSGGKAYVYTKSANEWIDATETAILTSDDIEIGKFADGFSRSLAISQDTIFVGALEEDGIGNITENSGAIYIYKKPVNGWVTTSTALRFAPSDNGSNDYFGSSIAVEGNVLVVGALAKDIDNGLGNKTFQGAAYIFETSSGDWNDLMQKALLSASDGSSYDSFGKTLDISDKTIVVGAYRNRVNSIIGVGSAYVFEKPNAGWIDMKETAILGASVIRKDDNIGNAVAIDKDTIAVGSRLYYGYPKENQGAVFLYQKPTAGWADMNETLMISASNAKNYDFFGNSVALDNNTLFVGASGIDRTEGETTIKTTGGAYSYTLPETSQLPISALMYLLN